MDGMGGMDGMDGMIWCTPASIDAVTDCLPYGCQPSRHVDEPMNQGASVMQLEQDGVHAIFVDVDHALWNKDGLRQSSIHVVHFDAFNLLQQQG